MFGSIEKTYTVRMNTWGRVVVCDGFADPYPEVVFHSGQISVYERIGQGNLGSQWKQAASVGGRNVDGRMWSRVRPQRLHPG